MDKEYWRTLQRHPLSPNDSDVETYRGMMVPGSTLLLGCTHLLIPLSDCQLDIDPWYRGPNTVVGDWRNNETRFDNIIGDGVLNLEKSLCEGVLRMCSSYCEALVVRCFNRKLEGMVIATNFPKPGDFHIAPHRHLDMGDYSFYLWRFL